ncbi:MAG: hypothetical protein KAG97_13270, partial [Victivallales bacterium]|nr:hypothetical protein [Victivallales bacterium]
CGGGGGGAAPASGGTDDPVPNLKKVSGAFEDGGSSRVAGRSALAVADKLILAYAAGDAAKTRLNSAADKTDASGNYSVNVDIGASRTSLDVIIELTGESLSVAVESLSSDTASVNGDADTTRKAVIFHYVPAEALSTISLIDNTFDKKNIDVTRYVTDATMAGSFLTEMKAINNTCSITSSTLNDTQKGCLATEAQTRLASTDAGASVKNLVETLEVSYRVDLGTADDSDYLSDIARDADKEQIDSIVEMFEDGQITLYNVENTLTEEQIEELVAKMPYAITAWNATSETFDKRLAVKEELLAIYRGETYTYEDIKGKIGALKSAYHQYIQEIAAAESDLVSNAEMGSVITVYDVIRGILIKVMAEDVGTTSATGKASIDALLLVFASLGAASEDTGSMGAIMDNWVVDWDTDGVEAYLMTGLAPLEMDDSDKTEKLMRLAHDIEAEMPSDPTDEEILTILRRYLTETTSQEALALYHQYADNNCEYGYEANGFQGVTFTVNNDACPGKEEVIHLTETHYEKGTLSKLRLFVDGVESELANVENDDGVALAANYQAFIDVYERMKVSEANKTSISAALRKAGVHPELFWLAMNVEPYVNN